MPPHCDSMDGPVVKAAMKALDLNDVTIILPYVPKEAEKEVREAFEKVAVTRQLSEEARAVADSYFFETVVRLHRAGEGEAFTGLKPAGLGHGLVVPVAERAIEIGSADELLGLLSDSLLAEVTERFNHVMDLKSRSGESIDSDREYVSAMLGLEVYSHKLHQFIKSGPHHGREAH